MSQKILVVLTSFEKYPNLNGDRVVAGRGLDNAAHRIRR
jgi:hypothetical protein